MIFLLSGRDRESLNQLQLQFEQLSVSSSQCVFVHYHDYKDFEKTQISHTFSEFNFSTMHFCHLHSGWTPRLADLIQQQNQVIILDGGHVKKWEYFSRLRKLKQLLDDHNQVIVAISGSAILLGESLLPANFYGTAVDPQFPNGLGLVPAHVFPHGQRFSEKFYIEYAQKNHQPTVWSLEDGGIIVVKNKQMIFLDKLQTY